jgi:hypothetical protein
MAACARTVAPEAGAAMAASAAVISDLRSIMLAPSCQLIQHSPIRASPLLNMPL